MLSKKNTTEFQLNLSPELSHAINGLSPKEWANLESSHLLRQTNQFSPPVDLKSILHLRKIDTKVTSQNILGCSARLVPHHDGFKIIVRTEKEKKGNPWTKKRRRFTIAHEIGHTYFFDLDKAPPSRLPGLENYSPSEERLCDMFASALLMPEKLLLKRYASFDNEHFLSILQKLHNEFDVSYGAMALRLIKHLNLWKGILFTCQWLPKEVNWVTSIDNKKSGTADDQAWRLYWSVVPDDISKKLYIPKPTKYRNYTPSFKWDCIEKLANDLIVNEIKEFSITDIEAGRFSNLREILRTHLEDRPLFTGWATVIPRAWMNEKQKFNRDRRRDITVVLAFDL